MNAKELYQKILETYPDIGETTICSLHKPCAKSKRCDEASLHLYIDFDRVETEFDRGNSSRQSVDAVASAGEKFCFIEIKGWKDFLQWNIPNDKTIALQAQYDLKGKFEVSKEICIGIAENETLFEAIPEVFVLVTDIDVNEEGIESFFFNMMALASTATDWETKCNIALKRELDNQITSVPKYYVNCKQLAGKLLEISSEK